MDFNFKIGERFYNGDLYEIVDIDTEDTHYPYECYPVKTIEKVKHILENGTFKGIDNFGEKVYIFTGKDGEVYKFTENDKENGWEHIIYDYFPDCRECMSENEIHICKYNQLEKELKESKAKNSSSNDEPESNGLSKERNVAIAILDIFEDMLSDKGIIIPDEDREGDEDEGCLYGTTYYELEDQITEILEKKFGNN